jgi:hypothetical protein
MDKVAYESCPECSGQQRCEVCAQSLTHDGGSATRIGREWADRVATTVHDDRPWPAYDGKSADIARRLTGHLTAEHKRAEELARLCHRRAARRWKWLRTQQPQSEP